jgi:hypothetical protein
MPEPDRIIACAQYCTALVFPVPPYTARWRREHSLDSFRSAPTVAVGTNPPSTNGLPTLWVGDLHQNILAQMPIDTSNMSPFKEHVHGCHITTQPGPR